MEVLGRRSDPPKIELFREKMQKGYSYVGYECVGVMNVYDKLKDLRVGNEIPFRFADRENGDYQYG